MDEKRFKICVALFFISFILFVSDIITWRHYTHETIVYEFKSPVPVYMAKSNTIIGDYGWWGGVAGSSTLHVDSNLFWVKAKEHGSVWIVQDDEGWHVLTFGNETFAYELKYISNDEADKVVCSEHQVKFYGRQSKYGWLWFLISVASLYGMLVCGVFIIFS